MNINEPAPTSKLALPFTKAANPSSKFKHDAFRSSILAKVPDAARNHFVAMVGEFVGTVLFLYFGLSGAQVANSIASSAGLTVAQTGANPSQLQYISLSFGFSLAVNAWVFFRISGGLFNPAVTLGMCLIGALPWLRGCLLFVSQIIGGIAAAGLVSTMFPGELNVQTTLGGGTSITRGLFIEMILTAQLVFTIFMLAAEKHRGTFIAPVGIGLSLFVAEMTGVFFTGGSLNPARSFGPAVINGSFVGYHWIYWVGPILGAVLAAGFYKFIKVLEYETVNPGQDDDAEQHAAVLAAEGAGYAGKDMGGTDHDLPTTNAGFGTHPRKQQKHTNSYHGTMQGLSSGIHVRPPPIGRASTRIRTDSPGMGTTDDAFGGLATGMYGEERRGSTRVQQPVNGTVVNGNVVNGSAV